MRQRLVSLLLLMRVVWLLLLRRALLLLLLLVWLLTRKGSKRIKWVLSLLLLLLGWVLLVRGSSTLIIEALVLWGLLLRRRTTEVKLILIIILLLRHGLLLLGSRIWAVCKNASQRATGFFIHFLRHRWSRASNQVKDIISLGLCLGSRLLWLLLSWCITAKEVKLVQLSLWPASLILLMARMVARHWV